MLKVVPELWQALKEATLLVVMQKLVFVDPDALSTVALKLTLTVLPSGALAEDTVNDAGVVVLGLAAVSVLACVAWAVEVATQPSGATTSRKMTGYAWSRRAAARTVEIATLHANQGKGRSQSICRPKRAN